MKRLWILWCVLGLAGGAWLLGFIGCSGGPTGVFEGFQEFPGAPEDIAGSAGKIHVELKPDGRFLYQRLSMPWEGSWSMEDGKIRLVIDSAMNHPARADGITSPIRIELTPKGDDQLSLVDDFTKLGEPILLKRVPAKA